MGKEEKGAGAMPMSLAVCVCACGKRPLFIIIIILIIYFSHGRRVPARALNSHNICISTMILYKYIRAT